jgi:hypothetical protein
MQRAKAGIPAVVVVLCLLGISGCSSGHTSTLAAGSRLAARIIPAPYGYTVDTTPGADGAISSEVFDRFGGLGSPSKVGFLAGFKQNYVDDDTEEGIAVTLLEFRSAAAAATYLKVTAPTTLSYAAATHKPFPELPGAIEVDGTKPYGGDYAHGVVMTHGKFYVQLVYATAEPSTPPVEFVSWAKAQYQLAQ